MSASFVIPLESNPDVMNKYLKQLGVSSNYDLVDVYGLDDDVLNTIPEPKAVIMLFPISEAYEAHRKKEDESFGEKKPTIPENLFFMRQYVNNSCGTMALIHAIFNNLSVSQFKDESVMKNFYEKVKALSPEERGHLLEQNSDFINIHQSIANEGQTAPPPSEAPVTNHFITLVNVGGELYELDGRKNYPISHGSSSDATFLFDAVRVCKEFIARDPKENNFTVIAFAKSQ